jgi:hypothetical protein
MRSVQRLKGGQRLELPGGEVVLPFELVERSLSLEVRLVGIVDNCI